MTKTTIISFGVVALLLGALLWSARPTVQNNTASLFAGQNGKLTVEETNSYDFGTISMAAGNVTRQFTIKNTGANPVTIEKVYTSCMCTTAVLKIGDQDFGPYGMPGHGFIPKINESLVAGEEATVEVVFDPAAHGPAGVGRIQRIVTIENNAGEPLELQFTAVVTP